MKEFYITFRSITYAQKGQSALQRAGIRCQLRRTPRILEEKGCGYCLTVSQWDSMKAVKLLREVNILFKGCYLRGPDGNWEEQVL